MITYKCRNCGGEMSISPAGDLYCAYCGTKENFSDAELRGYRNYRNSMLQYLAAAAENKADAEATRKLWGYAETARYSTDDDQSIVVEYLFGAYDDGIQMYMAKESVIYVFDASRAEDADKMLRAISAVKFPQADMKGLNRYIPRLKARLELKGGGVFLAFVKEENMYPLGAFGCMEYRHAAWVLSRLENLCCVLEYSGMVHGAISLESIYINPYTHEAALYGGWWKAEDASRSEGKRDAVREKTKCRLNGKGLPGNKREQGQEDLCAIRAVCLRLLGVEKESAPKAFLEFLDSAPAEDAYTDFAEWDRVIETKLGGRHFAKFEVDTGKHATSV